MTHVIELIKPQILKESLLNLNPSIPYYIIVYIRNKGSMKKY